MTAFDAALALVPVALGYLLGRWDERRRGGQDKGAVRKALDIEIGHNLAELETLWADIDDPLRHRGERVADIALLPAVRLAQLPAPRWRRTVWEDQSPEVIDALDAAELEAVSRFYRHLNRFDALRGALGQPFVSLGGVLNFHPPNVERWRELRELILTLRAEGNPLPRYRVP